MYFFQQIRKIGALGSESKESLIGIKADKLYYLNKKLEIEGYYAMLQFN
jgi:hypothetical protein